MMNGCERRRSQGPSHSADAAAVPGSKLHDASLAMEMPGDGPGGTEAHPEMQGGPKVSDATITAPQNGQAAGRSPDDLIRELVESARLAAGIRSRKALAERLALTPRSLRNWLVEPSELSGEQIEKLVKALELGPENRDTLYRLTGQVPPAPSAGALLHTPEMAIYKQILDDSPHPSVVFDYAWDVVITNEPYRALFGSARPHATAWPLHNGMKYILFHPDAPQQLGGGDPEEFRDSWLMPALANFLAVFQQRPHDPHLRTIEQQIFQRAGTRRAYESIADWIRTSGDLHVNSSPRPIVDPRCQKLRHVHIITEAHQGYQPMTLTHATFVFSRIPVSAPLPE